MDFNDLAFSIPILCWRWFDRRELVATLRRCQGYSRVASRKPTFLIGICDRLSGIGIGRPSVLASWPPSPQPSVLRHGLLGSPPSSDTSRNSAPSAFNGFRTRFAIARATNSVLLKSNAGSAIGPWIR